jgi:DNA-binding IclR family transcriptional regulator
LNAEQLQIEVRKIRAAGFAVNRGELVPHVYAVGAPIFDSQGRCCASISVAGTRSEFTEERIADVARSVVATAAMVSRQLGYSASRFSVIA